MDAAVVLGLLALVLSVAISVPQVWVSLVRRETAGLSFASNANASVSSTLWCVFAVYRGDVWLLSSSVVYVAAGVLVILSLVLFNGVFSDWTQSALWLALTSTALAVSTLGWWPGAVSVVLVFGALAWGAPQVVRAWRSPSVSGVSTVSWAFVVVDAVVWLAYGLVTGTGTLVFWAVVTLSCALAILTRKWTSHKEAARSGSRPPARVVTPPPV